MTISFFCGMLRMQNFILFLLMFGAADAFAQKYELFRIEQNDVYWTSTYSFQGSADSLRREVVQMLKSKFYTFNVVRNEDGYNGELKHYKVDCKRFGRRYGNTPRMYWYGEWTGKFIVEVLDNHYRVTVYALYAEKFQPAGNNNRGQRISTGRYIEAVTKKDRMTFKKGEYANLDLMNLSLKAEFDIRNTVIPNP